MLSWSKERGKQLSYTNSWWLAAKSSVTYPTVEMPYKRGTLAEPQAYRWTTLLIRATGCPEGLQWYGTRTNLVKGSLLEERKGRYMVDEDAIAGLGLHLDKA